MFSLIFPTKKQIQQELLAWEEKIRMEKPLEELERLKSRFEQELNDVEFKARDNGTSEKLRFADAGYRRLIGQVDKKVSWIIYEIKMGLLRTYLLQKEAIGHREYPPLHEHEYRIVDESRIVDRMASVSGAPQAVAKRVFDTVDLMDISAVESELYSLEVMRETELGDLEYLEQGVGFFFEDDEDFWNDETKEKNFVFFKVWFEELDDAWKANSVLDEQDRLTDSKEEKWMEGLYQKLESDTSSESQSNLLASEEASEQDIMKLGFADKAGEFVTFSQVAKTLPKEYPSNGEYGLPTATERAVIGGMDRFYDFFQVIYVDENRVDSKFSPNEIGWYWVTYFYPRSGFGTIGPFSDEHEALTNACSHALPLNDPRRKKHKYGYVGNDIEMCCSAPRMNELER
jgi:hypothetical protein